MAETYEALDMAANHRNVCRILPYITVMHPTTQSKNARESERGDFREKIPLIELPHLPGIEPGSPYWETSPLGALPSRPLRKWQRIKPAHSKFQVLRQLLGKTETYYKSFISSTVMLNIPDKFGKHGYAFHADSLIECAKLWQRMLYLSGYYVLVKIPHCLDANLQCSVIREQSLIDEDCHMASVQVHLLRHELHTYTTSAIRISFGCRETKEVSLSSSRGQAITAVYHRRNDRARFKNVCSLFAVTFRINPAKKKKTCIDLLHPTKESRVRFPEGSLPDFRTWESWRTMLLVSGISLGTPVSAAHSHFDSPSSAFKTPLFGAAQIFQLRSSFRDKITREGYLNFPTQCLVNRGDEARDERTSVARSHFVLLGLWYAKYHHPGRKDKGTWNINY
ncbi:hypothetical protein PR048_026985 [Dryococelus australis]|uniref:Uncharacterized protein n=1 Tax=Dryococelus australis TaxID=614101 RepID=A0ABQ9GMT7_9NEOP|nr:hypothetical protein PR048_026985 [Dryococelus australis]